MGRQSTKTALITGYTGQDGTFLTDYLLQKGYRVIGLVRRISTEPPMRVRGRFDFTPAIEARDLILAEGDLLSRSSLDRIIKDYQPDEIYNLAAQSHVGVSFKQPEFTIEADFMGVVNLIEALCAHGKDWKMYQASTSEMFGDIPAGRDGLRFKLSENEKLDPNSPYAIAKMAAHQYCKMKRKQGYFISCGILFNHESEIRGGDFVTQKIIRGAVDFIEAYENQDDLPILKLGNLEAKRDWGYAGDYVKAMWRMLQQDTPDDFVVGTGISHTVRDFVELAFREVGHQIHWAGSKYDIGNIGNGELVVESVPEFYRPNDVGYLEAHAEKARTVLGWEPKVGFEELVKTMVNAELERRGH